MFLFLLLFVPNVLAQTFPNNRVVLPYISEIHYDDVGTDVNEFIEVTGEAGSDLSNVDLAIYTGDSQSAVETLAATPVPDEGLWIRDGVTNVGTQEFGFFFLPPNIIGVCLVIDGTVEDFISFGGVISPAVSGPCNTMTSRDVGPSESDATADGSSIEFYAGASGPGTWTATASESAGTLHEAAVAGDPHFRPFKNSTVQYTPFGPPAVYNIITHPFFQWNTLWYNTKEFHSLVKEAGITFLSTKILVTITKQGVSASVDKRSVKLGDTVNFGPNDEGSVSKRAGKAGVHYVLIKTPLVIIWYSQKKTRSSQYLNCVVKPNDESALSFAHGILGQTARPEVPYRIPQNEKEKKNCVACWVRGNLSQYIVTDGLFGANFDFNRFLSTSNLTKK